MKYNQRKSVCGFIIRKYFVLAVCLPGGRAKHLSKAVSVRTERALNRNSQVVDAWLQELFYFLPESEHSTLKFDLHFSL